ncbi:ABC transporter substrate-binding protein [Methanobacterium sp.]|uniref:ABC transporter substrate-binding protein n=1 Tax=Methanobacterium sp. TaxID=2164 RepID=UPI003C7656F2
MIYISMDDTDSLESRGTGSLARTIAKKLANHYKIFGVTRHQLYEHPDIPFTSHNTCAVIHVDDKGEDAVNELFEIVKNEMLMDFIEGSDPGIAVAERHQITPPLIAFGKDAKNIILNQKQARTLAANLKIKLEGLGGTEEGVIGTMAGLGLANSRYDGRFLMPGQSEIMGSNTVLELLNMGVDAVYTLDGRQIKDGTIYSRNERLVKPCPVGDKVVLYVEEKDGILKAVNRD